jgi:hypothetical protein
MSSRMESIKFQGIGCPTLLQVTGNWLSHSASGVTCTLGEPNCDASLGRKRV